MDIIQLYWEDIKKQIRESRVSFNKQWDLLKQDYENAKEWRKQYKEREAYFDEVYEFVKEHPEFEEEIFPFAHIEPQEPKKFPFKNSPFFPRSETVPIYPALFAKGPEQEDPYRGQIEMFLQAQGLLLIAGGLFGYGVGFWKGRKWVLTPGWQTRTWRNRRMRLQAGSSMGKLYAFSYIRKFPRTFCLLWLSTKGLQLLIPSGDIYEAGAITLTGWGILRGSYRRGWLGALYGGACLGGVAYIAGLGIKSKNKELNYTAFGDWLEEHPTITRLWDWPRKHLDHFWYQMFENPTTKPLFTSYLDNEEPKPRKIIHLQPSPQEKQTPFQPHYGGPKNPPPPPSSSSSPKGM